MPVADVAKHSRKRKQLVEDDAPAENLFEADNLEMLSDEEDDGSEESDDGHVDEFPEIDTRSDGDSDEDELTDDAGDSESEDESEEDHGLDSDSHSDDSELHIFPKAKTIISEVTGQEKRVYPEIEPEYDSDSSTEDV